jgi:hypothetical protein
VVAPPAWLQSDKEAPFDVKAYFAIPSEAENAAPIYLDALFEFSNDLSGCFPKSAENDARAAKARERAQKFQTLLQVDLAAPEKIDRRAILDAATEYREGYRKLNEAQKRPKCVFATSLDLTALLPHVQAARQVTRFNALMILPFLDQGDVPGALAYANATLRLSRDLQPRGSTIGNLVSVAIDAMTYESMIKPILRSPTITAAQCDAVLRMLLDHEAAQVGPYTETLKGEYVMLRTQLRMLAGKAARDKTAEARRAREAALKTLAPTNSSEKDVAEKRALLDGLARTTPKELTRAESEVNTLFRDLLAAAKLPYAQRTAEVHRVFQALPNATSPEKFVRLVIPELDALDDAATRKQTSLNAMKALACVRRWQIVHKALPKDLESACKEANLPAVPADPWSTTGQVLKYTVMENEPVVYSVGKDGKDDGGIDSVFNTRPGDLPFTLKPYVRPK